MRYSDLTRNPVNNWITDPSKLRGHVVTFEELEKIVEEMMERYHKEGNPKD